jgi:hypothetical protein
MTKLTKDTFEARFTELCAGVSHAEQALSQASFQATTGYASQADVDKARGHLSALQQQRDDLGRAWQVQQEEDQKQFKQRRTDAWQAATGKVEAMLAQQKADEASIARAVEVIGECFTRHRATGQAMKDLLKPYFSKGPRALENVADMAEIVAPGVASISFTIAGGLKLHDVDLSGVNVDHAAQRIRDSGMFSHTEHRVKQVRALLERNTVD